MIVDQGEKVHVIIRRLFEEDLRRHFVGEVQDVENDIMRVEGYTFIFDLSTNQYLKRKEKRIRVIAMGDALNIINILPSASDIEKVEYVQSPDRRLVVTDHSTFSLSINEFGTNQ